MLTQFRRLVHALRQDGVLSLSGKVRRRYRIHRQAAQYQKWIAEYDTLTNAGRLSMKETVYKFAYKPLISIVMPVYDVGEKWLRLALDSILDQIYPYWELCIADDASQRAHVKAVLEEYAARDQRIKVVFRQTNGNISVASNSALQLVTGEYVALMDHDDVLAEHALFEVVRLLNSAPEINLVYSDEDKIDKRNRRFYPMIKPDWSPEMMRSLNITTHFCVFRTDVLRKIGGFRVGFEGSQDYDLALRFVEQVPDETIRHLPFILYHWRAIPGSVAFGSAEKTYAHERARAAIREHYERVGVDADVVKGISELHHSIFRLSDPLPKISIVGGGTVLQRIISKGDYDAEIEVSSPEKLGATRYASMNEAVSGSSGEVIVFLSDSAVDASFGWLRELVSRAMQSGVGLVGAKIADTYNRIIHAGYFLGINGGVGRAHFGQAADSPGEFMRLAVAQNFSAVSIDCMAVRREVFDAFEGFDTHSFPENYGDVDLCLRTGSAGYRTVWTPWAKVTQAATAELPFNEELARLKEKWIEYFGNDPFYNANLTLEKEDLSFAFPPRRMSGRKPED